MTWLLPSVIATLAGSFLLAVAFFCIYQQDRERHVLIWTIGWAFYALRFVFQLGIVAIGSNAWLVIGNQGFVLLSGLFLIWGTFLFTNRSLPRWIAVATIVCVLWVAVTVLLDYSLSITSIPGFTFLALLYIWTGIIFLRIPENKGLSRIFTGWAFIVWGIHKADYPFLRPIEGFAPWGFLLGAVLEFSVALGIILFYFQQARSNLRVQEKILRDTLLKSQKAEEQYRALFNGTGDAIFVHDFFGKILDVNSVACSWLGYTQAELLNMNLADLQLQSQGGGLVDQLDGLRSNDRTMLYETVFVDQNGMECAVELHARLIEHKETKAILSVARDIGERKKMQSTLIATQKLADLGMLSAGIAHEVNSPLQVIIGLSSGMLNRLKKATVDMVQLEGNVETINRSAWRITEIMRSLLAFARSSGNDDNLYDLNKIVRDTLLLIEHQLQNWSNVQVIPDLAEGELFFHCDQNKMIQVIINLLVNARDAMPDGGRIVLKTGYIKDSEHVYLKVVDSGEGIPSAIQKKIFDPFFTTKKPGKGTGLGLSIVLDIVQSYGGKIDVESSDKGGATFTIIFPVKVNEPFQVGVTTN